MENVSSNNQDRLELGSEWIKWDLHFHTPSSYDYGDKSVTDQEIVDTLIQNNIRAVAITDHNAIDINRINNIKSLSKNELTVFPGIELCSEMRGNDPIHFIGVFPEDADITYIWSQLDVKAGIAEQRKKNNSDNEIYCDLKDTAKLIKELGGLVTIHAGSKSNSVENITNSLPVKMAQKKDIVENVDIFELGNLTDKDDYEKIVFPSIKKEFPMIMCSDDHNVKNYKPKENLWIKAKPSFAGLRQVLLEHKRIYIGSIPPILEEVMKNPSKFISSLVINKRDYYKGEHGDWFDNVHIHFNPELNVVIGNKGSGKSAISDTIGLLGNSENFKHFSFLNTKKFQKRGYGDNFNATLEWCAIQKNKSKALNSQQEDNAVMDVKYLPQNYFENLCNDLESSNFEEELQSVIFRRLDDEEKLGANTFGQLVAIKTKAISEELEKEKKLLDTKNNEIFELEKKLHPNYLAKLNNQLSSLKNEIDAHNKTKPEEITNPSTDKMTEEKHKKIQEEIDKIDQRLTTVQASIDEKENRKITLRSEKIQISNFTSRVKQISDDVTRSLEEYKDIINKIGTESPLITISYDKVKIEEYETKLDLELLQIQAFLAQDKEEIVKKDLETKLQKDLDGLVDMNLIIQRADLLKEKEIKLAELSLPFKKYEKYKQDLKLWEGKLIELEGKSENPATNTKQFLEKEIKYVTNEAKANLLILRTDRKEISEKIYKFRYKIIQVFDELKKVISSIIQGNDKLLKHYNIEIVASFRFGYDFSKKVSDLVNMNVSGYFYRDGDNKKINELFKDFDLNDFYKINEANEGFIDKLEEENLPNKSHIHDQIKNPVELYNYLFGFDNLEERYELTLNNKSLEILSPGERGALLLVFYLMIDEEECPLIIDQPEDNLDNKSVYEILVHFIKEAKLKRQIILVTHNPNLAVGADAENIIYVDINKSDKNKFTFISGAIEDKSINEKLVEVLEGTMPAFNLRKLKYLYGQ